MDAFSHLGKGVSGALGVATRRGIVLTNTVLFDTIIIYKRKYDRRFTVFLKNYGCHICLVFLDFRAGLRCNS